MPRAFKISARHYQSKADHWVNSPKSLKPSMALLVEKIPHWNQANRWKWSHHSLPTDRRKFTTECFKLVSPNHWSYRKTRHTSWTLPYRSRRSGYQNGYSSFNHRRLPRFIPYQRWSRRSAARPTWEQKKEALIAYNNLISAHPAVQPFPPASVLRMLSNRT